LFALLFILPAAVAPAEEKKLSLNEAIKTALEGNHELRASRNSLSASKEDIGVARSALLPKLTFEERFMRTDNPTLAFSSKLNQQRFARGDFEIPSLNSPNAINDFQTSFSFEQPLFARKANIGLAMTKLEYDAQREDFTRKREEIAYRVARTYLMVRTAREYEQIAAKTVGDAKEHLRITELRLNAGFGLRSDTLRAYTAVIEAEQKLVSARKNLSVAKRALGVLLGMSASVDITDEAPELQVMEINYYDKAAQSRKDIVSLERRNEIAKSGILLAKAGYLPTIGIGGGYQLNDHEKPFGTEGESWHVAAFLRWEIFDGAKSGHERAKAAFIANETAEHLDGLREAVSFRVYETWLGVEEAKINTDFAKAALKTAEEGRRLVKVRFENSLSPLVDLLDAQISLDHARAGLAARDNEYKTAITALGYESGTLLRDLKIE
jgi:outer membrane protein TolC